MEAAAAETLRRGEWSPRELLGMVREIVPDEIGREALYDGLRNRIAHLLRSEALSEEFTSWRETTARIIALAIDAAPAESLDPCHVLAIRLGVIRDMSADSISYESAYAVERLGEQPHFRNCLRIVIGEGGVMARSDLLPKLNLKEANGTRVLKVLEGAKLIKRVRVGGGNIRVEVTARGREALVGWEALANKVDEPSFIAQPDGSNIIAVNFKARLRLGGGPIEGVDEPDEGWSAVPQRSQG